MDRTTLQFDGVRNPQLLAALLAAVVLSLVVVGVWQFVRRRWRYGMTCMAAALGPPVFVPLLVTDGVMRYFRGESRRAKGPLLAAAAVTAATLGGVALVMATGRSVHAMWMAALGLWVAMAVGVFYAAVFSHIGTRRITTLMILRSTAIIALLLILFKPAISVQPDIASSKPYRPILVDRSGSMSIPPPERSMAKSRYAQAVKLLALERAKIEEHFRPVWYHFGEDVNAAESLSAMSLMEPRGKGTESSDLAKAIRKSAENYTADELPGVLVLSDGIHNASSFARLSDVVTDAGVPVFAVGVGSKSDTSSTGRNLRLAEVNVPVEVIKNNVTTIRARVGMTGFAGDPGELRVREQGSGEPIAVQRLWTDKNSETLTVELKWTPKTVGPPDKEGNSPSSAVRKLFISVPVKEGEAIKADNEIEAHVLVTEPRLRVLYVEGQMRPEYRFLKRMFDTDPNVQYVALIRVSENRFWSYGRLDGKAVTHLPTTDEDFKRWDVIILGSLDRSFLEPRRGGAGRMSKIRDFVNNGGGLLMLGGQQSFGPGGYTGTDVEKVLPVVVGGRGMKQEATPFLPKLTALGERHPILEGITGYFTGPGGAKPKEGLAKLPLLRGCVAVERVKATASLLAVHPASKDSTGAPLVVLAVHQYGAGRAAAFTPDTTWQWYLPLRAMGADSPYERFWGQLVRWLAKVDTKSKESKPSVLLRLDHSYIQVGQTIKISARIQDEKGRAVPDGQATCTISEVNGTSDPETLPLAAQAGGKLFTGTYRPIKDGQYLVKVVASDTKGTPLGEDELKLLAAPFSAELATVALNDANLRNIAYRTHGKYFDLAGLPEVIDEIIERQKMAAGPVPKSHQYPLYNFTLLFLIFVALLTAEWITRRSWQLR